MKKRGKKKIVGDYGGRFGAEVFFRHRCNPFGGLRFGRWWKFARHAPAAFFISKSNFQKTVKPKTWFFNLRFKIYDIRINCNIKRANIRKWYLF